jgi:hypothetical protein
MLKKCLATLFLFVLYLVPGCVSVNKTHVPTSIEIQAMQTKEFDVPYKIAFASVVDVFQDLGFVILSSDFTTRLIIAKGNVTNENIALLEAMGAVRSKAVWNVAPAPVEELSDGTISIRISFVTNTKIMFEYGPSNESSKARHDGEFYTNFLKE